MANRYPSLKDIVDELATTLEVIQFAEKNELVDHPLIRQRLRKNISISDVLNNIADPDSLIEWAISNLMLNHGQVEKRLKTLLTCKYCQYEFGSSNELKNHQLIHQMSDTFPPQYSNVGASGSLTCSWCRVKLQSHGQLREHEEFHRMIDDVCDKYVHQNPQISDEINVQDIEGLQLSESDEQFSTVLEDQTAIIGLGKIIADASIHDGSIVDTEKGHNEVNNQIISPYAFQQVFRTEPESLDHDTCNIPRSHPSSQNIEKLQYEAGNSDDIPYTFQQTNQKTFAKNLARETTCRIQFRTGWKNKKMKDLIKQVHPMFDDVLSNVKENDGDLGRIVINHPELNHPIVVPLDKWANIDTNRVINSDENLYKYV